MNSLIAKCKNVVPVLSGAFFMAAVYANSVMAATDTSSVTKPLDNLKTLVIAIIGAIGVIILAKKCHGVCASLPAAGFIDYEFSIKRYRGRRNDGGYFIGTCNFRILENSGCMPEREKVRKSWTYLI